MPGPISFDPAGRCVLVTGGGYHGGSFLFHMEILGKASSITHKGLVISEDVDYLGHLREQTEEREPGNDEPKKISFEVSSIVLNLFKRWAYHGDFNGCGLQKLEDVVYAVQQNHNWLGVRGFEDALVDRAINILTEDPIAAKPDDVQNLILETKSWCNWPYTFRNFFFDWIILGEHTALLLDSINESILKGECDESFARYFASRCLEVKLQPRSDAGLPWESNPCQYHAHKSGRDCYKVAGAIDIWRK